MGRNRRGPIPSMAFALYCRKCDGAEPRRDSALDRAGIGTPVANLRGVAIRCPARRMDPPPHSVAGLISSGSLEAPQMSSRTRAFASTQIANLSAPSDFGTRCGMLRVSDLRAQHIIPTLPVRRDETKR